MATTKKQAEAKLKDFLENHDRASCPLSGQRCASECINFIFPKVSKIVSNNKKITWVTSIPYCNFFKIGILR